MLPVANNYGDWPRSGHIVIADSRGNENLKCKKSDEELGVQKVWQKVFLESHNQQLIEFYWSRSVHFISLRI